MARQFYLPILLVPLLLLTACKFQSKLDPDQYEPNNSYEDAYNLGPVENGSFLNVQANFHDRNQDSSDWYKIFVVDSSTFADELIVQLSAIPDGSNYDIFLYSDENPPALITLSANNGNSNETINYTWTDVLGSDDSKNYYIEVRCTNGAATEEYYTLRTTLGE